MANEVEQDELATETVDQEPADVTPVADATGAWRCGSGRGEAAGSEGEPAPDAQ